MLAATNQFCRLDGTEALREIRCAEIPGAVGASPLSQAATVLGVNTLRRPCQTKAAQSKTPSVILSCYDLFSTAATVRLLRNGSNYWTACELSLW